MSRHINPNQKVNTKTKTQNNKTKHVTIVKILEVTLNFLSLYAYSYRNTLESTAP